jgi:glyoxylase I family protein
VPVRYSHTNLIARDWRRLVAFYTEVFDCSPVPPQRDQSGDWLSKGTGVPRAKLEGMHLRLPGWGDDGPTLEIYTFEETLGKPRPVAANRLGLGHIAFHVDDVGATHDRVIALGGSELGDIVQHRVDGVGTLTFVYMTDPEGNVIEIQNWS